MAASGLKKPGCSSREAKPSSPSRAAPPAPSGGASATAGPTPNVAKRCRWLRYSDVSEDVASDDDTSVTAGTPSLSARLDRAAPADDAPGREPPKLAAGGVRAKRNRDPPRLSAGICFFSLASPQELRGDFFSLVQEPLRLEPSTLALSPGPVTTTSCALGRPSRSTSVNAT